MERCVSCLEHVPVAKRNEIQWKDHNLIYQTNFILVELHTFRWITSTTKIQEYYITYCEIKLHQKHIVNVESVNFIINKWITFSVKYSNLLHLQMWYNWKWLKTSICIIKRIFCNIHICSLQ